MQCLCSFRRNRKIRYKSGAMRKTNCDSKSENPCSSCPSKDICKTKNPEIELQKERIRMNTKKVKKKILVMSGKGGVGKSTVSCHLALFFARDPNKKVALVDLDVSTPSVATIMDCPLNTIQNEEGRISPFYIQSNLCVISTGQLFEEETPIIWKGSKKDNFIRMILEVVDWNEIDYMIFDTPPGTTEEHLAVTECLDALQVILITTPQDVSLCDVTKQFNFCKRKDLNVIGLVENMNVFLCPCCNKQSYIFSKDGGKRLSENLNIPFLGSIPLKKEIARECDTGIVNSNIFNSDEVFEQIINKLDSSY